MRRLHRIAMALWIAAATSCGSTGGALVTLPFRAGGQQAGGPLTFTSQSGWTVTLRTAKISLGPFYFNSVPASTETFRNGLVIIQVTRQVVVDALDPSLHDVLGGADGESGHAVAVEIGLFPPDTTQPSSTRSELGSNFGLVAGTATKGSTTVAFSGPVAVDTSVLTPQNAALLQLGLVLNLPRPLLTSGAPQRSDRRQHGDAGSNHACHSIPLPTAAPTTRATAWQTGRGRLARRTGCWS